MKDVPAYKSKNILRGMSEHSHNFNEWMYLAEIGAQPRYAIVLWRQKKPHRKCEAFRLVLRDNLLSIRDLGFYKLCQLFKRFLPA